MEIPRPLTPADADLRSFAFMPLDVSRFRKSRALAMLPPEHFMPWFSLILESWHQLPAASLPDDDIELAALAGFGRQVNLWQEIREGALYGWVKCADGRLYHPVVAEKANEAWLSRLNERHRKYASREKKSGNDPEPFKDWLETASPDTFALVTRKDGECHTDGHGTEPGSHTENRSFPRREGEGQGQGEEREGVNARARDPSPSPAPSGPSPPTAVCEQAMTIWNEIAEPIGLPMAQRLTTNRRKKLRARLAECGGLDGWRSACAKVGESPFLCGANDRGWRADIDFVLQPSSFTKLMEGSYARGPHQPRGRTGSPTGGVATARRIIERRRAMSGGAAP